MHKTLASIDVRKEVGEGREGGKEQGREEVIQRDRDKIGISDVGMHNKT